MVASRVGGPAYTASSGNFSAALPQMPTAGNVLTMVYKASAGLGGASHPAVSGWNQVVDAVASAGLGGHSFSMYYRIATGTESGPSFGTGSTNCNVIIEEWAGLDPDNPFLAATGTPSTATAASGTLASPSVTVAVPALIFSGLGGSGGVTSVTWGGGSVVSAPYNLSGSNTVATGAQQIESGTATPTATYQSPAAGRFWVGSMAFKLAPVAPPPTRFVNVGGLAVPVTRLTNVGGLAVPVTRTVRKV